MTRLDPEDIFHVHAIDLHLVLYTSEKQGKVTWNYWLNSRVKLAEGKELEPYLCDLWDEQQSQPSFQCSVSLGAVSFSSACQCMKYAGLSSVALKKPDSLKRVETSTQRGEHRDCQNTSIMALEVMHVCINVINSCEETARSFIQVK